MAQIKALVNGKQIDWVPDHLPGIVAVPWRTRAKFIKDFIKKNKLVPAKIEILVGGRKLPRYPRWWLYGLPHEPHLHLGNKIYLVNKEQWSKAVEGLVQGTTIKLEGARKIGFEPLMEQIAEEDISRLAGGH